MINTTGFQDVVLRTGDRKMRIRQEFTKYVIRCFLLSNKQRIGNYVRPTEGRSKHNLNY
jgi:hypothetical protein